MTLASEQELSDFLASVEKRAFKQASFGVQDEHTALDIVQDAMIKLVDNYRQRPVEELPLLFHRILQNTLRDHYRRQKLRNVWTRLFSDMGWQDNTADEDDDPLDRMLLPDNSLAFPRPDDAMERARLLALIETEVKKLPARQQQAFILRYWEDIDIAETAILMGCTEGSVKTHCSRATITLATALRAKGVTL